MSGKNKYVIDVTRHGDFTTCFDEYYPAWWEVRIHHEGVQKAFVTINGTKSKQEVLKIGTRLKVAIIEAERILSV